MGESLLQYWEAGNLEENRVPFTKYNTCPHCLLAPFEILDPAIVIISIQASLRARRRLGTARIEAVNNVLQNTQSPVLQTLIARLIQTLAPTLPPDAYYPPSSSRTAKSPGKESTYRTGSPMEAGQAWEGHQSNLPRSSTELT